MSIANRIMISPMCTYQAGTDGLAVDTHFAHYAQFAFGGAGLIMLEATAVEARGRISAGDLGLWSDEQIGPLRNIVEFVHKQGSKAGIQLAHAGFKGSTRPPWEGNGYLDESDTKKGRTPWQVVGPSKSDYLTDVPSPKILTTLDIKNIISAWGEAAIRANKAGFDVIEIHGAHGYLISEFLSPLSNLRTDGYGGDNGRTQLALEVVKAVRENWPEGKPIFFRMSVIDGIDIGWTVDDSVALAKSLQDIGVDLIDCSSGGLNVERHQAIPRTLGFQVFLAEALKQRTSLNVAAVGLITETKQAENILQSSQADIIAIGRTALNDPYWPRHAAQHLNADKHFEQWPEQYGWWLNRWSRTLSHLSVEGDKKTWVHNV